VLTELPAGEMVLASATVQAVQLPSTVAAVVVPYLPATQSSQIDLPPVVSYLPFEQSWQVSSDVAPVAVEYLPAAQGVQLSVVCAAVPKYFPATQSTQKDFPVLFSYLPAAQSAHTVRPVMALNLPVGHELHKATPVSTSLNLPTGHSEQEREPINENFPFRHSVHDTCSVAPDVASTFPEGHPTQVEFHG